LQQNDPLQVRDMHATASYGEDLGSPELATKNESLNNLVGGTTNLLELKLGGRHGRGGGLTDSPRLNASYLSSHGGTFDASTLSSHPLTADNHDINIIDFTKDRNDLNVEFEQVCVRFINTFFDIFVPDKF
jgi:hypothetical protein